MDTRESIAKALPHLLKFQLDDGRFEGELSSNTFPTCVYALVQVSLEKPVDDELIKWFAQNQNENGLWGLDVSGGSDESATLLAKLALNEISRTTGYKDTIEPILRKIPELQQRAWIVKLLYARSGYISWSEVIAPKALSAVMRIAEWLSSILPKALLSRFKPPVRYAPPLRLFYSSIFQDMFIAEKYTLAPLFLIMEIHTSKRREVISDLINWLLENRWSDGSWFRVGLITALSVMALIDAVDAGYGDAGVKLAVDEGAQWLQNLRSSDGGCREALNLNVWDTALSIIALESVDSKQYKPHIDRAVKWLIENQNKDGGWAFTGMPGGNLLSDADDTALAVFALIRSGIGREHVSVSKGIKWLKSHQTDEGGWGTYIPGTGDMDCISITSHVILAFLEMGGMEAEIEKAVAWIKGNISDSGYWYDLWLVRNTYGTALAIDALIRTGHGNSDEVKRGVKWLKEFQNPDGGWGEDINGQRIESTIEQTAWSTYALLKYDPENPEAQRGLEYLLSNQNPDGSWNASCVGIYWEVIGGYADPVYPYVFSFMALSQALSS